MEWAGLELCKIVADANCAACSQMGRTVTDVIVHMLIHCAIIVTFRYSTDLRSNMRGGVSLTRIEQITLYQPTPLKIVRQRDSAILGEVLHLPYDRRLLLVLTARCVDRSRYGNSGTKIKIHLGDRMLFLQVLLHVAVAQAAHRLTSYLQ